MITLGVTDGDDTISVDVVTRAVDSYDANGNGVKGVELAPVSIEADIQPVTGKTLQDLPEGIREEVQFFMWTPYDLKTDHIIVHEGERFRVFMTLERRSDGFTKAAIGVIKNDR